MIASVGTSLCRNSPYCFWETSRLSVWGTLWGTVVDSPTTAVTRIAASCISP